MYKYILIFVVVVLDSRSKFQFVQWGLGKFYEKDDIEFLCEKINEESYKLFNVYNIYVCLGKYVENYSHSYDMEIEELEPPYYHLLWNLRQI